MMNALSLQKKLVLDMCRFSALVYLDAADMAQQYQDFEHAPPVLQRCRTTPVLIENTEDYNDGQCYLAGYNHNNTDGLLGFRGTENFRDWMTDFNVVRVRMETKNIPLADSPLVHFGFIRQYRTMDTQINQKVERMIADGMETLHVCGHSLGGALASIACIQLHHVFPELKIHCYTFGSPRPGDKAFAAVFKESVQSSYRFLNSQDPVTATPTTWRFKHVDGGYWIYPDGIEDENRTTHWNRFWGILYHGFRSFIGRVDDSLASFHAIDKYYTDIETRWQE